MSEKKQSDTLAETPAQPVELSSEELNRVAGGLAGPTVPGHPGGTGQQGIIAILIGL